MQAADGISLYEDDEELTCNLCQRRFEEQGTWVSPDDHTILSGVVDLPYIFRLCVSKCVCVSTDWSVYWILGKLLVFKFLHSWTICVLVHLFIYLMHVIFVKHVLKVHSLLSGHLIMFIDARTYLDKKHTNTTRITHAFRILYLM